MTKIAPNREKFAIIAALVLPLCSLTLFPAPVHPAENMGAAKSVERRAYGFKHKETTGITAFIIVNGKEYAIQFSPRSNRSALKAFDALQSGILLANADGKRMWVVGYLEPAVKRTPDAPNMAQSEPYQEFVLTGWYIIRPFREYVWPESWGPDEHERTVTRRRLTPHSFTQPVSGDLRRFERHTAPSGRANMARM